MQDVYEVLRAKEILIEQVAREIEALRLVAPLLSDDTDSGSRLAGAAGFWREPEAQSVGVRRRVGEGYPLVNEEGHERNNGHR